MLVANLFDQAEVLQVIAAALRGSVSLVSLDREPDPGAMQMLELHAPGLDKPIRLVGRLEGAPVAGMFPLRLGPVDPTQAETLRAFLRSRGAIEPPSATAAPVGPDLRGRYAVASRRPAAVTIPRAPEGHVREPPAPVALQSPGVDRQAGRLELVFGAPGRDDDSPGTAAASQAFEDTLATRAPRAWEEPDDTIINTTDPRAASAAMDMDAERTVVERLPATDRDPTDVTATQAPVAVPLSTRDAEAEDERDADGLPPGHTLSGGKYVIESLIGTGGAGRVYRARHSALDTPVAIKVLHARHQRDDRFAARFRHEARATSMLDHPNVMRVLDFGQEDDGVMYIVMEYLQGQDLQQMIEQGAPMPETRIVSILSQVCAALSSAHEIGIIHRDMKPENVIVMQRRDDDGGPTDVVKVCDFGLAKIQELTQKKHGSGVNLTLLGTIWGTPEYMSPEQIRDELLDPRSDVYACGVILYEMATGRLPYEGDSAVEILGKHISNEPLPPSRLHAGVSPGLEAVILRAMSKDRTRRPAGARELRAELRALLAGTSGVTGGTPAPRVAPARPQVPVAPPDRAPVAAAAVEQDEQAADPPSTVQTVPHVKASMLAAELADRLVNEPPAAARAFREMLDAEQTPGTDGPLEMTLVMLASQGEMRALWQLVAGLDRIARDREGELEPKHRAMATRALQSLAEGPALVDVARALIDGPATTRAPSREILTMLGVLGARALCQCRVDGGVSPAGRGRFVAVMREMGTGAVTALGDTLTDMDPARLDGDPAMVEDLLRAVPEERNEAFAEVALKYVGARAAGIRRAAAGALLVVRGARAVETLMALFDDPDDAVRITALVGLRRLHAVDAGMVKRIEYVLKQGAAVEESLASTALTALSGVTAGALEPALRLLTRVVEPGGFWARMLGRAHPRQSDYLIETAARALLAIGGPAARTVVARAVRRERGSLSARLAALLERG